MRLIPPLVQDNATPSLILEHHAQVIATFDFQDRSWNVGRDRQGWHPQPTQTPINTLQITYLAIAPGTSVLSARSVLHLARLHAMEHAREWVICTLKGPQWPQNAALARWRDDQNPLLWTFWLEGFVDVSNTHEIQMIWRNPAF